MTPTRYTPTNPLRKADWTVRPIDPAFGRAMIARYHYAGGTSNTVTACHGLVHRETRITKGIAWWIPPTKGAAKACLRGNAELGVCDVSGEHNWRGVLSLSRLVLVPELPTNAATFLMMRSVAQLSASWPVLATWADTERGHTGGIYKAAGWESLGLSQPTDVWVDADGRRVARKAGPKTRTHATMRDLGHIFLGYFAKHRFRLIRRHVPAAPQRPVTLFDLLEAVS